MAILSLPLETQRITSENNFVDHQIAMHNMILVLQKTLTIVQGVAL